MLSYIEVLAVAVPTIGALIAVVFQLVRQRIESVREEACRKTTELQRRVELLEKKADNHTKSIVALEILINEPQSGDYRTFGKSEEGQ